MWLVINEGFLSIVKHRDKEDTYLVRARKEQHITDNFDSLFVIDWADYPYRCEINEEQLIEFLVDYVQNRLIYSNFKNSLNTDAFKSFCGELWHLGWMHFFGDRPDEMKEW